jgi:hypothetical protein
MRRLPTARAILAICLGLGLAFLGPTVVPAALGAAASCAAAADGPHAGLVVDTGGRTTTYCVALDADRVSGIHLIELAASQYGLQYRLGFGGKAVCQLDGVGPNGDDCFAQSPSFWGYWHGDGGNGWDWASQGAGSSSVADGGMDGWSWGTGMNGATHPPPPALGFDDVCTPHPPSPSPSPSRSPSRSPPPSPPRTTPGSGAGSGVGGGASRGPTSPVPRATAHGHPTASSLTAVSADPTSSAASSPTASGTGDIVRVAAIASSGGAGGGPPIAALVTLVLIVALVATGALRLRTGRRRPRGRSSP